MGRSVKGTQREVEANDPPIEVNQEWVAYVDRKIFRRIRILAPYPEPAPNKNRWWIYEELPGAMMTMVGQISRVPEFNLRYVFRLKKGI